MPNSQLIKTCAPGTLMLMGEHAVLYNKLAIVCAIDKQIKIALKPRADKIITIESALGFHSTALETIKIIKPFSFVLAAIKQRQTELSAGFDLSIKSEFSHLVGFGSSAAVTVATVAALNKLIANAQIDKMTIFNQARAAMLATQGAGSGADIAAAVFGGTVAYQMQPLSIEKLANNPKICAIYCGYKTPTPEVISLIAKKFDKEPLALATIFSQMNECSIAAKTAINNSNWQGLGELFVKNQKLMIELGVSDSTLNSLINIINNEPNILGAKISGAGLGDCVIGLGKIKNNLELPHKCKIIPVQISQTGVTIRS